MTEPATPEGATPDGKQETPATTPAATPQAPESTDEGKGGKDAILADLAKERDRRQKAENDFKAFQESHTNTLDAIAKALGLKEDAPDASAIAKQLEESQRTAAENAAALTRYQVAVEKAVPANLVEFVTGSTREEVEASVEKVLAAFNAAPQGQKGPRPDPSQGQQGAPASLDALIAQAEAAGNTREAIRLKARKAISTN